VKHYIPHIVGLVILASYAFAGNLPTQSEANISLEQASLVATTAMTDCLTKGYKVTATVVDASGLVKVSLRADGAAPHTVSTSRRKAYTSASAKAATSALLANSQSNPTAQNLGQIDDFLLLGGGLPITLQGSVVGAVGVGGAPGGPLDEQCAQAGIDKLLESHP
jgi:uncharacterized protein GlcG (DUF336 family)